MNAFVSWLNDLTQNSIVFWLSGFLPGALAGAIFKGFVDEYRLSLQKDRWVKDLRGELRTFRSRLLKMKEAYKIVLEAYAVGVRCGELPPKFTNSVHKKYYPDVVARFGESKRESAEMIDSYINALNEGVQHLNDVMPPNSEQGNRAALDEWADSVKAQYKNVCRALWHVEYHLSTEHPFLDHQGEDWERYYKNEDDVEKEIEGLIEFAKSNYSADRYAKP